MGNISGTLPCAAGCSMDSHDIRRHADMLSGRLRKRQKHLRRRFERQNIGAYRLYDWDIPEVRASVDWYEGHLVIAELVRQQTQGTGWAEAMAQAAGATLGVVQERVFLKRRQTGQGVRYGKRTERPYEVEVREGEVRFSCNLNQRVDVGLFLDHRQTRLRVGAECAGRSLLNLYGYTGAFTCHAAHGRAAATTTVDRSRTYIDWARRNLKLNGLLRREHELVVSDCEAFLDDARKQGRQWDLIVLDPPSFSTAGSDKALDIQRDHRRLVGKTLQLLEPGGTLYFSTNHQQFEPDLERLGVSVAEITAETVPEDFRRQPHRCFRLQQR